MKSVILCFLLVIFASGCIAPVPLVPFTHELRSEYKLSKEELTQLQYYVSDTITLQREMSSSEKQVTPGHNLKLVKDKQVEEVVVLPRTPGIATIIVDWAMNISFEEGNALTFTCKHGDAETISGGRYQLGFANIKNNEVDYDKKKYQVITGCYAYILIDLQELNKFKKDSRTVPGIKLK